MKVLDHYTLTRPSAQNAIDLFQGEWSSRFPDSLGLVALPGTATLFEDGRIRWSEACLGGFKGRRILELGPLEGGHSYMLQQGGASQVVAIEANTRCFLKCLIVKELLRLDRVEFRLGDFTAYLQQTDEAFDIVIASGVLYHMAEPLKLIDRVARVAPDVMYWTHYYDKAVIRASPALARRFGPQQPLAHGGETYEYAQQTYRAERGRAAFCGGSQPTSRWLTRDSLLRALRNCGYTGIEVGFEDPHHPNGPALAICATRRPGWRGQAR
jgi:SAM-dependent methyltransferase